MCTCIGTCGYPKEARKILLKNDGDRRALIMQSDARKMKFVRFLKG